MPGSLIGAGFAAMLAFYFTRGRFNGLIIPAILLLASRFTAWRLPSTRILSWGIRLIGLGVVLMLFRDHSTEDSTVWYLNESDTKVAGYALIAELVLRAWERHPPARARESRGITLLVTVLIFMGATHTYEREAIQRITPLYMVCVLFALRSFAEIGQPSDIVRTLRRELVAIRMIVLLVSLGIAFAATYLVTRFEYQVTSWASQIINSKHTKSAEIGFSMEPRLGSESNPEPTLDRVLLIDGPPIEQHLRVMAFDTYASPRWLPSMTDRTFQAATLPNVATSGAIRQLRFTRVGDVANLLPVPLEATKIEATDALEEDELATLRDKDADDNPPYNVSISSVPDLQGALSTEPGEQERQKLLAIPEQIAPLVIELAKRIAGTGDSRTKIIKIQMYLRSHHDYSLSFDAHGEPLSDFILNNRAAHCQYFASAVVIMARAVGIPARFVSGFYAHERYGSDEMVVRSRDSHAWAECWIDGVGWITVDATPSGGRPDAMFQDPPAWKRWWEKLTDLPAKIKAWVIHQGTAGKMIAAVLAGVALVGWIVQRIVRRRRRPKTSQLGYGPDNEDLTVLARRFEKWLRNHYGICPPPQTWRDYLSTVAIPAELLSFVRIYDRARFGADRTAIAQADQLLSQLEARKQINPGKKK
jgi:transglutaminase-like putative cysteine protease